MTGPGNEVDEAHFLNFVAQQLQGDPAEELRECWKITSNQTKQTVGAAGVCVTDPV